MILAGIFFSGYRFLAFDPDLDEASGVRPVIGHISLTSNDIRHKSASAYQWQKAHAQDGVQLGDSIFTGAKSRSEVRLKTGGVVNISESTLVTFRKVDMSSVPDLMAGNLVLDVRGQMKIAIKGEIFELSGKGGQVEVSFPKESRAPVFRVIDSDSTVSIGHRNKKTDLRKNESVSIALAPSKSSAPQAADAPVPALRESLAELTDVDQVSDWYSEEKGELIRRTERFQRSRLQAGVGWTFPQESRFFFQASRTKDFSQISQQEEVPDASALLNPLYVGDNYWRVSTDRQHWSQAGVVRVAPRLLKIEKLDIELENPRLLILAQDVTVNAFLKADDDFNTFLVEVSQSAAFEPDRTRVTRVEGLRFVSSHNEAGRFYFRARAVNAQGQVSDYSPAKAVDIFKPALPEVPRLTERSLETFRGKPVALEWSGTAPLYEVVVKDEAGKTVTRTKAKNTKFHTVFPREGKYEVSLRSIDRWGRPSVSAEQARIQVLSPPAVAKSVPPLLKRMPSQEQTVVTKLLPTEPYLNDRYRSSIFQVEGAGVAMYSREEIDQGSEVETAFTVTLRNLTWWGAQGFEGSFRKALMSPDSGGGTTAPLQIEARYLRRWDLAFNPFSSRKDSEFVLKAGYEYYRNTGSALFAPKYDLLKLGFGLAFPMLRQMDTGGEVLYGLGLDGSSKYEISGHMHYYLRPDLSLGMGYRIHLFIAGSDESSPLGAPYREGYGEGYSVLRWHY